MDMTDRLLEYDAWSTARLIENAEQLKAADLDREIRPGHVVFSFAGPEPSVRLMFANHVYEKEVWVAAMSGDKIPTESDNDLSALRVRHDTAAKRFRDIARGIRDRGEWDDAFVDALCDPPQSFTYGSVVAHIIEHAAHRRAMLITVLKELGVKDVESGDPIDWENALNG